jgi:hypothetical protein
MRVMRVIQVLQESAMGVAWNVRDAHGQKLIKIILQ